MIGKQLQKSGIDYQEYARVSEWCNQNNATIKDMGEYYEVISIPPPTEEEQATIEIQELEKYLKDTDYMVIKCMERGISMEMEYPSDYIRRQQARDRINELKGGQYGNNT